MTGALETRGDQGRGGKLRYKRESPDDKIYYVGMKTRSPRFPFYSGALHSVGGGNGVYRKIPGAIEASRFNQTGMAGGGLRRRRKRCRKMAEVARYSNLSISFMTLRLRLECGGIVI